MVEVMSLPVILAVLAVGCYIFIKRRYSFWTSRGVPGPAPLPIIGNLLDYNERPVHDIYTKYESKYGKVYGMFEGLVPKMVVTDLQLLKKIMVSDFSHFTDRRVQGFDHPIERLLMFVLEGQEWKTMRGICSSAFSSAKLRGMIPLMYGCADKLITEIRVENEQKQDINASHFLQSYALDVIGRTAFGVEFDNYNPDKLDARMKKALKYLIPNTFKSILSRLLPRSFKTAINFTVFDKDALDAFILLCKDVINERRKTLSHPKQAKYDDFITILLKVGQKDQESNEVTSGTKVLTDNEITANTFLFMAAGFFTVAIHLSITCFLLAKHPEVQDKLLEELKEAVGTDGKGIEALTGDVVSGLKYLDAVIKESFRMYPPSTYTERKVSQEYKMQAPNGKDTISIPKGTLVFIPIYTIHHSEDYWKNPEEFNPDRFLPENKDSIDPFALMPLGQGPRMCIASRFADVNIRIAIARLVYLFKIQVCEKTPSYPLDVSETNDEMIVFEDIWLKFKSR